MPRTTPSAKLALVRALTRRHFLQSSSLSLGAVALASLSGAAAPLGGPALAQSPVDGSPALPLGLHHAPRAKRVIYLQMLGGPSQLDLFDYKPKLKALHGQDVPAELMAGQRLAFSQGTKQFLGPAYEFAQHGDCGAWISDRLPQLARQADRLAIVRSVQTDQFNHGPAQVMLTTGFPNLGRPSMGAWVSYGLGSANQNLPTFVVLVPANRNSGGKGMWGAGFLPARYQGVEFRLKDEAVPFVANPAGIDPAARQDTIETITALDRLRQQQLADPQLAGSIASYELAFQMQASVPELMDLGQETPDTLRRYGIGQLESNFARSCLLARRLVERGVRFVQICYEGEGAKGIWDSHGDTKMASLEVGLPYLCRQIDQPTAALIADLDERGLLEDTLVVWGGEFGRTCLHEDRPGKAEKGFTGRDHWPHAGTMWLAGGGVRPGLQLGATDELGHQVVEDPVHIHDLNATILHLLGLDHTRLTFRTQGRDFRLTDVHGRLVEKLLA